MSKKKEKVDWRVLCTGLVCLAGFGGWLAYLGYNGWVRFIVILAIGSTIGVAIPSRLIKSYIK